MPESPEYAGYEGQQYFSDVNTRLRDFEEKQRILKDRVLIMGKNLVEEREKTFSEIQEIKKTLLLIKEETLKMREALQNITEQVNKGARKEELAIIQRQLDLLRKD